MKNTSWREVIANQNHFYFQVCHAYQRVYPNVDFEELICIPIELYQKILLLSSTDFQTQDSSTIIDNLKEFNGVESNYRSEFFEKIVECQAGEYIYLRENISKGYLIHTVAYFIAGFLLVHGQEYFGDKFTIDQLKIIYFILFGNHDSKADIDNFFGESVRRVYYEDFSEEDIKKGNIKKDNVIEQIQSLMINFYSGVKYLTTYLPIKIEKNGFNYLAENQLDKKISRIVIMWLDKYEEVFTNSFREKEEEPK